MKNQLTLFLCFLILSFYTKSIIAEKVENSESMELTENNSNTNSEKENESGKLTEGEVVVAKDDVKQKFDRFVNVESFELKEQFLVNSHDSSVKNFYNKMALEQPKNEYCIPLFNTAQFESKRLQETIYNFKFNTSIEMYFPGGWWISWKLVIFDTDIPKGRSTYSQIEKEICDNGILYSGFTQFIDTKMNCNTREFKKDNVVALCSGGYSLWVQNQKFTIRTSGYVLAKKD